MLPLVDIVVKNARFIVTMDKERRLIRDGALAVDNGKIVDVGKTRDIAGKYNQAERKFDAKDQLITPGFIDCHCHSTQSLARGLTDNVFLNTWLHDRIYPYESSMTASDTYISSMLTCLELIKTGTTCFADPGGYHHIDQVVRAAEESGIRAVLARACHDVHSAGRPVPEEIRGSTEKAAAEAEELVKKYDRTAEGRIRMWFTVMSERLASDHLMKMLKMLADKYNVGLQTHVAAIPDSVNRHKELFHGKRPIERYNELGILGPNLLIFHAVWLSKDEVELLRKNDVKVCHCPSASFHGGYGALSHGKFIAMMKKGITVALGADASAESNFLDMLRVMYLVTGHRDAKVDATLFPAETVVEMATTNGARALGAENEIGSLEIGKKADFVMFNLKRPEWTPLLNPVSNLVHSACGDSADTVVVDGKIVMEERRLETMNEAEILDMAQKAAEKIVDRVGLQEVVKPDWKVV